MNGMSFLWLYVQTTNHVVTCFFCVCILFIIKTLPDIRLFPPAHTSGSTRKP
ncbi:hypothetical protein HanIR_Chr14g0696811 [Helianthus annuus]|nr:hypothetical protein HanIR_Chr14g0696811 [Helianthus annuus]